MNLAVQLHTSALDVPLAVAGLLVGLVVGLTGMGGGALLTPILVLVFGIPPLAAVSSDLVTSLVMKPVGAVVHLRRGTVDRRLVMWLCLGSVPAALAGALLAGTALRSPQDQGFLKGAIGVALLGSVGAHVFRLVLNRRPARAAAPSTGDSAPVQPGRAVLIGLVGGAAVGLTSVGAGSLIIALLVLACPRLTPGRLVGTDIVQAIPLVAAAAVGHLLVGDVRIAVTASLLVGALPGIYAGARLSSAAPARLVRPLVAGVLAASALALLRVPTPVLLPGAALVLVLVTLLGLSPRGQRVEAAGA